MITAGRAEDHRLAATAVADADAAIEALAPHEALASIWRIVDALNGYLAEQAPWKVAKEDLERTGTILATAAEGLRVLAVVLAPIMPKATEVLWQSLGAEHALGALADQRIDDVATWDQLPAGTTITKPASLFPRIEA